MRGFIRRPIGDLFNLLQTTVLPKISTEIAKNSTEVLHFAAQFSVQSRSLATDFSCNFVILYSRVIRCVQLTSLSAVRDLINLPVGKWTHS